MNERIKELVERTFIITTDGKFGHVSNHMVERFAAQIVQECAWICELKEQGYSEYDPNMSVGWYMKRHFGVKE